MHLQSLHEHQITRLVIGIAPGHAKSTIISQMFPVWVWLNDPYSRWLCASHSLDLAIRDNRYRRRLIESDWFQERYSHIFTFAPDQRVKGYYENSKKGYHMAVAVRSSGTGKRASHLLIDDANNAMAGKADLEATKEWFGKTWMSRLNDQEKGPMIVVGQRLDAEDLIGHILQLGGWEHLCLPEEYEPARHCVTSIGWEDPRKEEGELLWPEKFPHTVLAKLKATLGSMNYAAQYQQSPVPSSGGQFKREWFRYFTETPDAYILENPDGVRSLFKTQCWQFITLDLAISSKQSADFTVFAVWSVTPDNDLLLVDVVRARLSNPEQIKQMHLLHRQYPGSYFKIESVAYQLALIQQALVEGIPCKEFRPAKKGDKVARASIAAIWMENGKYYFPKHVSWMNDVESELLLFPKAAHDDIVDNFSMSADEVTDGSRGLEPLDDELSQIISNYVGY